ncbi:MAG: T9SS type A sorting domain-containing protein [Bacteroidales bacterium]|nr:T9SS type A sorting domain-containing protein [Bacteroidales bacterium]
MNIKANFTLILLISLLFTQLLPAQEIAIGEWRDHLPYQSAISVASNNERVYCATEYGIFYFDKADNSLNRLTRVQGLSDIGISKIGYNTQVRTLVVAYQNTNIDLIKGNTIINMPDILSSSAITPEERAINEMIFIDNLVYLSCGFGIVVIDLEKEEVKDTWYIGPNGSHLKVNSLTFSDNQFFAATDEGIYFADRSDPNLAYFGAWSKDETLPEPNEKYSHIAWYQNVLVTSKYSDEWGNDTVMAKRNDVWEKPEEFSSNNDVWAIKVLDNKFHVVQRYSVRIYDVDLNTDNVIWTYGSSSPVPRDVDFDNSGLWIADERAGLAFEIGYANFSFYYPNGPALSEVYAMDMEGEDLWVVPGGRDLSWGNLWKRSNIFSFVNGSWKSFNNISEGCEPLDSIRDLLTVKINPYNKKQVYIGSWYQGLIEFDNNTFNTIYSPLNSSLEYKTNQGPPVCKIGGLAFDNNGNLWMTNSGANNILAVKINEGASSSWRSFYLGSQSSGKDIGELIIDSYGQKWIMWRQGYLIVFNDNDTPNNPSDDNVKHLSSSQGNGGIPGSKVYSVAEDLDGEMWIGTDEGIAVIYSPENVFSQYSFDAQRILIPRNDGTGLADILLEFETITAIAVDGNNNKWIGTDRSGVYLISADGLEEIHHFTTDNSPLLSNNITDIEINNVTGEVFFGTADGIVSFKGTSTVGGKTNSDVYAYPNPVRPGYTGPIAIKGLVNNANFKVTDISGSLVYSGRAEGGQAIWPGTNFTGRRVQSGVYLVYVTDDTGTEKMVTKILFIN